MKIKQNTVALIRVSVVLTLVTMQVVAQYGHPGVESDPTPLVQAKRLRRPISRSTATSRPVIQTSTRSSTSPKEPPTTQIAERTAAEPPPLPESKIESKSVVISTPAPTLPPPVSTFEDLIARAEAADERGDAREAARSYGEA